MANGKKEKKKFAGRVAPDFDFCRREHTLVFPLQENNNIFSCISYGIDIQLCSYTLAPSIYLLQEMFHFKQLLPVFSWLKQTT